ncbi:30S ribosomal protein S17 [Burkholderia mallei ATCC 10399]|nr:30S ribosomal protein S17 [Burkholderia mallei ATCC 10399]
MKASELLQKDQAALNKELSDLLKAQFGLRMQLATQQLTNTSQLKKVRRDIARVRDRPDSEGEPEMNDSVKTSLKRTLVGKVVSNKMDKTVTVLVEHRVKHPIYGKYVVRSKKYHAHDEANTYNEGDLVEIQETRPVSKTKAWAVSRLVEAARVI